MEGGMAYVLPCTDPGESQVGTSLAYAMIQFWLPEFSSCENQSMGRQLGHRCLVDMEEGILFSIPVQT